MNENWSIAINLDVTGYHDVITIVREDLLLLNIQRGEFPAVS
jgi:hypothetical protein